MFVLIDDTLQMINWKINTDQQQHRQQQQKGYKYTNCYRFIVLWPGKHVCVGYCTEEVSVTFWVFIKLFFLDIYDLWLQKTAGFKGWKFEKQKFHKNYGGRSAYHPFIQLFSLARPIKKISRDLIY